jgi:hypothetical protein
MRTLTQAQFTAYARQQIDKAVGMLAGHHPGRGRLCSGGKEVPCLVAEAPPPTRAGSVCRAVCGDRDFAAIEGPTGLGKTTLAARLALALDAAAVFDPFGRWVAGPGTGGLRMGTTRRWRYGSS